MTTIINAFFQIVFSLFEALITGISELIVTATQPKRKVEHTADFGKADKQLTKNKGQGFCIGEWSNSLHESRNHMICLGGSGSKKSSSIVFNTLLKSHSSSYIIMDPSKELLHGTATALKEQGYTILVLDYNNPEQSEGVNVLAKCTSYADVYKIANILVRNSLEGSSYDYWAQSAESLIAFFCKYLIGYAEPEYVTLPNVLHLLRVFSYSPKLIDKLIIKTNSDLITEYKSIVATPDKTLQSSLATAKNALRIYESPNVAQITSYNTFEFDDFRKQKCALYICSSAADSFLFRAITASFFESFFSYILSKPSSDEDISLMFLIDEAATIKISLSQALALSRKHNTSIATFWQDYNQIEQIYGRYEAANIFSNSSLKVFMPSGQPLSTCKMLSELLGKYTYDDGGQTKIRELLSAQEIHELTKMLVLIGNKPPLLLEPKQYFEIKELYKKSQLPQYIPENKMPFTLIPLLPLEKRNETKA